MKMVVVTASVSRQAGGLFHSVRRLHQSLAQLPGVGVQVLTIRDEFTAADLPAWQPLPVRVFPRTGPRQFSYAPQLGEALVASDADLVHNHGLWMYPSVAVCAWHRKREQPYMVSSRGMLDPWALHNARWKKGVASWLFESAHLRGATCLHALCQSEAEAIRAYGLKNPICIIPNGFDLPEDGGQRETSNIEWKQGRKILLYLGRIHPKKGLVNLLRAWKATLNSQPSTVNSWVLALAGWDQGGHEAELKRLATELGIPWADVREAPPSPPRSGESDATLAQGPSPAGAGEGGRRPGEGSQAQPIRHGEGLGVRARGEVSNPSSVFHPPPSLLFLGPQFGEAKAACYANCDAFVLPSLSEGLPMAVLEAWAYGKPMLMTPECNLPEGFAADAAIRIETNPKSIEQGLTDLFRHPPSDLRSLGQRGRELVVEKFTWPKLAVEMKTVYEWLLGGGSPPDCVQMS